MPTADRDIFLQLQRIGATEWPNVLKALEKTRSRFAEVRKLLDDLDSSDTSIVVFGSLARSEWTTGSDLDWTLLVDGQADPAHLDSVHKIQSKLKAAKFVDPGPSGVFGNMAFSHDIIHQIGGEDDTNRNITQRILLILESKTVGRSEAYERVVRNVLESYLANGSPAGSLEAKVPRFLLNDIVRYWRTITVDFVYKKRERAGQKWALRNAKLRMSRKVIFAAGLLMCLTCDKSLLPIFGKESPLERVNDCIKHTPLRILAEASLVLEVPAKTVRDLFDSYDDFLAVLDTEAHRSELEALDEDRKDDSAVFQRIRETGHRFQSGLSSMFFKGDRGLAELTMKYGVF